MYWAYPSRSRRPWPLKLNAITFGSFRRFASSASSIAPLIAWHVSGAGTIPYVRANNAPASNVLSWSNARASMIPWFRRRLTDGAAP